MNMEDIDNIKTRLKKLMDHAESAKKIGNEAEASAFASKITDLLLKHNLSKKEIIDHNEESEVTGITTDFEVKKAHGEWQSSLLSVLCKYNYCAAIFHSHHTEKQHVTVIVGTPENVEVVSYLYGVLKEKFQYLSKKRFAERIKEVQKLNEHPMAALLGAGIRRDDIKELKDGICTIKRPWKYIKSFPNRGKFLKSFYKGVIKGIITKLEEDKVRNEKSDLGSQITALVKVNDAAVKDYMDIHFSDVKEMSSRKSKVDPKAYYDGLDAGKNSSMAKGLANGDSIATKHLS